MRQNQEAKSKHRPHAADERRREMAEESPAVSSDEDDVQIDNTSPWPYMDKYMLLIETTPKSYVFSCLLCKPKNKMLSTSKTSNTNLRTHIKVSSGSFT